MFGRNSVVAGIYLLGLVISTPVIADTIYTFSFTGRATLTDLTGQIVRNTESIGVLDPFGLQTPIAATMTYNADSGSGNIGLSIGLFDFLPDTTPVTLHDIQISQLGNIMGDGRELFLGNMLVDWDYFVDMPASIVWDGTGLVNAINTGLQVGDKVSGNQLWRDTDGDGSFDLLVNGDLNSAIPLNDGYNAQTGWTISQGPAPLTTTAWDVTPLCVETSLFMECAGVYPIGVLPLLYDPNGIPGSPITSGPLQPISISLDIGSGNSLHVLAISEVPLPATAWLFGSGLLGLMSLVKFRKAA